MQTTLDDRHPIFEACWTGDFKTVAGFLAEGVSVYAESEHNPAIFGIAASRGHKRVLELMIQYGLDITLPHNRFGSSVAEFAIAKDSVEWLEYFHLLGVPIDAADKYGTTLTNKAAAGGKTECLKWLLGKGALIERAHYLGGSPFFEAARNNQIAALDILLQAGADREARDGDQNTPLIIAAKAGKIEAVAWLLDHGADISAEADSGKNALDWAKANGHQKVIELLTTRVDG